MYGDVMLKFLLCRFTSKSRCLLLLTKATETTTGLNMMFSKRHDNLQFPSDYHITLPAGLSHIELCHVCNSHYDVSVNMDGSLPKVPPYIGNAFSSLAADCITIT